MFYFRNFISSRYNNTRYDTIFATGRTRLRRAYTSNTRIIIIIIIIRRERSGIIVTRAMPAGQGTRDGRLGGGGQG